MINGIDLQIMNYLQQNARISNAEIARQVGLAPSAVFERIRKLEERGIVRGYRAQIEPKAIDLGQLAFMFIRSNERPGAVGTGARLAEIPEILELHHVAGEDCFLAKVRARDAEALGRHWKDAALVGGLSLLGGNGLVTWAEQRVPSGVAALIVASVPIWMAVLVGIEKRARPGAAVIAGLLLGLAGIALLVLPGRFAGNGHVDPLGAAALLTAALCWSFGSLVSRRVALPSSTSMATAMEMIGGG